MDTIFSTQSFDLPNELWNLVFSFLDEIDLLSVSQVCKKWATIANSSTLWNNLAMRRKVSNWHSLLHKKKETQLDGKSLMKKYNQACHTGRNFLNGPFGHTTKLQISYNDNTPTFCESNWKVKGMVPLLFKRRYHGGSCIGLLLPR